MPFSSILGGNRVTDVRELFFATSSGTNGNLSVCFYNKKTALKRLGTVFDLYLYFVRSLCFIYNPFSERYLSASIAARHPVPAAVTA